MTMLIPGDTRCRLKSCSVLIRPEFGYVKAIDPETGEEVFFCSECYPKQAQLWKYRPLFPQQIPAN